MRRNQRIAAENPSPGPDLPMSYVYIFVVLGFAAMTVRSIQVAIRHWRQGESDLTRVAVEGRHQ